MQRRIRHYITNGEIKAKRARVEKKSEGKESERETERENQEKKNP